MKLFHVLSRFFTAKTQFVKTLLDNGGKYVTGILCKMTAFSYSF